MLYDSSWDYVFIFESLVAVITVCNLMPFVKKEYQKSKEGSV